MKSSVRTLIISTIALFTFGAWQPGEELRLPSETHLANIRQLTFGGENAEAYLSFGGDRLIFQSTRDSLQCDQIFSMTLDGGNVTMVSTGAGRTTCSYFLPGDTSVLYSSTHGHGAGCLEKPDYSLGYVWPVYRAYDIWTRDLKGGEPRILSASDGYDAEATVSPRGDRIVFTSSRDNDLELYSMNTDGSDVVRLTHEIGYDGGAFYSADGSKIIYRSHHPSDSAGIADFQRLLAAGLVRPSVMEIQIMNADGSGKKQLTDFGAASFAPYFHPDGKQIVFASNMKDPKGRNFDIFLMKIDGSGLEQVTFNDSFDGFPVFTADGRHLIFSSNRNAAIEGETNVFIADWIP